MASPYTQDTRIGSFNTPVGKDELVITSFEGSEGMNEPFEFKIEAINTNESILKFDDAIGKNCTLTMHTLAGGRRHFDGILTEARWLSAHHAGFGYRLTLRPWLWLLSKRWNSLIFREKTAPQIIKLIFDDHAGVAKYEENYSKDFPVLEYCTQYRESDMAFVCRLMEQHGISYHFLHEDGAHKLILADSVSAYQPVEGGTRPFVAVDNHHHRQIENIFVWQPDRKFTTGKVTLDDYDFKRPSADLTAEKTGDAKYANGQLEDYDYPGGYVENSVGLDYAQVRLNSDRAEDGRYFAEGDALSFYPGSLVTLTDHPDAAQNEQYLILRCDHAFTGETYRSTTGTDEPYEGRFELMRADRQYCPPMITEKPFIGGSQTAEVITEKKGEDDIEIDCDEHGRILVRFHWDRKTDQSRRSRVAQVWAHKNWGAIFIPRIGMEVVVNFLEGDPDQPIIVGAVYNGENKPPYTLPDDAHISGWKSNSTKGGDGYNEFIMNDKKGSELVRFHAEKDLESTIDNDETRTVKHDRKTHVENNDRLDVDQELYIEAGAKISLVVGESSIVMDGQTITITSPTVNIKAKFEFNSKSDLMSKHEGSAFMVIKGGMVQIN